MPTETQKTPSQAGHPRILIVDDDPGQRSLLDSFLRGQGFETETVDSGAEGLARLRAGRFDMMISDVRMAGLNGLETLRLARKEHASLPVLLVTAFTDVRDAVAAMRDGAVNYLAKPIDLDELLACVRQAIGLSESAPPRSCEEKTVPDFLVARSPMMRAVLRDAALIAPSESRVLISGESGVGKEILADVLHAWSTRADGPMIKVNCAAIPEALLESELFGHERGAFTSAHARRIGRFEEACQGTIFLDEITEMSLALQAKLLRVTQDGRFQRIGSNREIQTSARILAATNRQLEEEVKRGRFREDLFYRLNVVELNIPPLRERREDILPLAVRFIEEFARGRGRFSETVAACLERYAWPGNVRELRNAMERAVLLSRSELILPEHLPTRVRAAGEALPPKTLADASQLEAIERDAILRALRQHRFNRTETAKSLGISRRTLIYKLQRFREQGYGVE
ncbi:MAG: sigma-54 dependent transcriptional regulator [Verrucomicrobia bacterium]|nr:sigma-54 dependent transcriptional regulator [Verrucomicrobiota bacterium]MDE3099534.1 sigma-54-dependent Fis family transcriptional regulator [Verrucomicrobiota bacterium]